MTNPQNPATANNVLQRVEALRPELPAHAEVTLDFRRFPIPDVPYLTVEKWALSSGQDWPLLAERRGELDRQKATRSLTDDEVRRVLYDDLKRSLWRPAPHGLALAWDERNLRLTVSWSPANLTPETKPVFATLAGTLDTTRANLIEAAPESTTAFSHAINDAARPQAPRPAFRVNIGNLDLPAGRYPGQNNDERTSQLYQQFKKTVGEVATRYQVEPDPQVRFNDDEREIEFDTYDSMLLSGLHGEVEALSFLPQFGRPPRHHEGPEPGVRSLIAPESGAHLRHIEHAFAVPGYREHRQADRRAMSAGLTYDIIAKAYQRFDEHFTSDRKQELSEVLAGALQRRSYAEAFEKFFELGGLVIGEYHHTPNAFQFVTENMPVMRNAGVTAFVCEIFHENQQVDLDDYILSQSERLSTALKIFVTITDSRRSRQNCLNPVKDFLWQAREQRIRVLAGEHPAAYFAAGVGRITTPVEAGEYDLEKRVAHYNLMATAADANHRPTDQEVVVHITGREHVNTSRRGYPGIAQFNGLPAVEITRIGGTLFPIPMREKQKWRLTEIPEHTSTSTAQSTVMSVARQTWMRTHLDSAPRHQLRT